MTQREFAKKLSVSQATISMALKDSPAISKELKNRIKQMAKEVGYSPNIAGQLLRRGKNNLIGCIFPSVHSSYYSELLIELFRSAQECGYLVILETINNDNDVKRAIENLKRQRISGIIAESCAGAIKDFDPSIPTVFLENYQYTPFDTDKFSAVYPDLYQAGRDMAEYMISTGKTKFTFLGKYNKDEERYSGFCDVCSQYSWVEVNDLPHDKKYDENGGYELTELLLKKYPETEIVLAHNDSMAIGVIRRLWELGIPVPGKIRVAGFDNNKFGKYSTPQLTTIGSDFQEFASKVIQTLTESVSKDGYKYRVPVNCKLEIRESC